MICMVLGACSERSLSFDLREVAVVKAADDDTLLAQPPSQQGAPCFVSNCPCTACIMYCFMLNQGQGYLILHLYSLCQTEAQITCQGMQLMCHGLYCMRTKAIGHAPNTPVDMC